MQLIAFLPAQFSRMPGKDICLLILKITQIRNSYLEKKMQQSKITSHSSCKFKTLLLSQSYSFKLASCTLHILHAYNDRSQVILYIICLYVLCMVILIAYPQGPSLCMHVNISKVYLNYCLLHNIFHAGFFGSCESVQMRQLFRCQLISYEITDLICNMCIFLWVASFEIIAFFFDYIYRLGRHLKPTNNT